MARPPLEAVVCEEAASPKLHAAACTGAEARGDCGANRVALRTGDCDGSGCDCCEGPSWDKANP